MYLIRFRSTAAAGRKRLKLRRPAPHARDKAKLKKVSCKIRKRNDPSRPQTYIFLKTKTWEPYGKHLKTTNECPYIASQQLQYYPPLTDLLLPSLSSLHHSSPSAWTHCTASVTKQSKPAAGVALPGSISRVKTLRDVDRSSCPLGVVPPGLRQPHYTFIAKRWH